MPFIQHTMGSDIYCYIIDYQNGRQLLTKEFTCPESIINNNFKNLVKGENNE